LTLYSSEQGNMAFYEKDEIKEILESAISDAREWRRDYKEFERLADNGLIEDLDEFEPEVNDGSLASSLFKLPKRIVNSNLTGRAKAMDADDAWITELANIVWEEKIIPNANTQAPFHRKWKDAVRKAAIYGGQPVITLFVENGDYVGSDFIVPQAQDVFLEPGKVSDYDSDIIFWEVYYSKKQVRDMIEQANNNTDDSKWDVKQLKKIVEMNDEQERDQDREHEERDDKAVKKGGIKFCIVFQRGVNAPFYMYHSGTDETVREWVNPDPTGDIPVHYLYCYQDLINPYGIGIVKLAGGTQNVLDTMRRADVLATQLGLRPPRLIEGNADDIDEDSLVYAEDANWYVGNAKVTRMEMANGIYGQLPGRIQMYQSSLNKVLPMGDTTISATAGDPIQSKTPAGVKQANASLSIDDDDFKDNLYMTYEAVAKSMINTHFANMEGNDLMKLSDEDRDILVQAGLPFPLDEEGNPASNDLNVIWDEARATFNFEMDAEDDKTKDEEKRLEGLLKVLEFVGADPTAVQEMMMSGKKFNKGELLATIVGLLTDNKKIIQDATPEDEASMQMQGMGQDPMMGQQMPQGMPEQMPQGQPQEMQMPEQMPQQAPQEQPPQDPQEVQQLMQEWGVDEPTANGMLAAVNAGFTAEEVVSYLGGQSGAQG